METLQYPIGRYHIPAEITQSQLDQWILVLELLPSKVRELVSSMSNDKLDTPYRPDGWTVRQVVHHLADSHHNSYIRFKWALTEDNPIIKPYDEKAWAQLPDLDKMPVEWSLRHLEVVHYKLVRLLRALNDTQLQRTFVHPASGETVSLKENIGQYAWHSEHHFAHIFNLAKRQNWK